MEFFADRSQNRRSLCLLWRINWFLTSKMTRNTRLHSTLTPSRKSAESKPKPRLQQLGRQLSSPLPPHLPKLPNQSLHLHLPNPNLPTPPSSPPFPNYHHMDQSSNHLRNPTSLRSQKQNTSFQPSNIFTNLTLSSNSISPILYLILFLNKCR